MLVSGDTIEFESAVWGPATIAVDDLELLSEFTGLSREECLADLAAYRLDEHAAAWREHEPRTAAEIRAFYSETDIYLWELLAWNGSAAYTPYLQLLERLARLWPPEEHPSALDYGAGIGSAALRLAELGYRVTVADVPGRTLEFARARFRQRGIPLDVVEVASDVPGLPPEACDVLVCFDVLEHVVDPAAVGRVLVRSLAPGGGAAVVTAFGAEDIHPYHLHSGVDRFRDHRWALYFESLGMQRLGGELYRKVDRWGALLRRFRYAIWRATGLYVQRLER